MTAVFLKGVVDPAGHLKMRFFMKVDGKFREVESAARLAFSKMTGCGAGATAPCGGLENFFKETVL